MSTLLLPRIHHACLPQALLLVAVASLSSACGDASKSPPSSDGSAPAPRSRWAAAVGAGGVFAQTFDGVSWATRSLTPRDLYAVTCVGNFDGWAAGEGGFVAHTADGGQTWAMQNAHTSASLRTIRFATAALGLVAGDDGALAVTQDGGTTWKTVTPLTRGSLRGVAVAADAGTMLAVGDGGVVLRSFDGGDTWSKTAISGGSDLRGVASDAGTHLVLAVDASGSVWSSTDMGLHFAHEASALAPLETIAVMADGSHAIAAGAHGTVLEWAAGAGWRAVSSGTAVNLHAALITGDDGSRHYVAGDTGALLGSSDWGTSWSRVAIETNGPLFSLDDL